MQPQDTQSVSRRALDIEDYIDILRRHKSWIFGPTFAAIVIATVLACLWPNTYVSTGTIRVVPPKVPEAYVPSNLNTDLSGRFNSMYQAIMTKDRLQQIVLDFNLYPKERKRLPMLDVVDAMRQKDIRLNALNSVGQVGGRSVSAFQIGFAYSDRVVAQKVASRIIGSLIEQNLQETERVTTNTTEFMGTSRDQARKALDAVEQRLSDFRQAHMGQLPEQQGSNYNQLAALQTQLLNLNASMGRVNQDKLVMENQIRIFKDRLAQLKDPSPQDLVVARKNEKLAEKDREILYYENQLAATRERYKESHPDVQSLITRLATSRRQRDELQKEELSKKPEPVVARPPSEEFQRQKGDLDASIKQMQGLIQAKNLEMEGYEKTVVQVNETLKSVEARLQGMPTGTREYEELLRDRELAKHEFEDLDRKVTASKMSTKVITNQEGESLELVEEASIPQTPTEPKRGMIIGAGAGLGLILGLCLAAGRELKDTSLKNLKDVRAYTQLPILGSIPLLENDLIVRRRKRLSWVAWATACLLGVVVMAGSVVYYYSTQV